MRCLVAFGLLLLFASPAAAQSLESFIAQLGSPDAESRAMASCHLHRLRAEAAPATDALIAVLDDNRLLSGDVCRDILGRRNWFGWGAELVQTTPAHLAAEALGDIGPSALGALHRALNAPGARKRRHVIRAIGEIEQVDSIQPLSRVLARDDDRDVREAAAWALGNIESARAVEALVGALDDPEIRVREQVAWALGNIESRAAVPALSAAADDQSPLVRERVAWALGNIEDLSATDTLIRMMDDGDVGVRRMAAWALGNLD